LEAIRDISRFRETAAIPVLTESLKDTEPMIRSLAAKTLALLGAYSCVGKLMPLLQDPDPIVRKSVSQALSMLTRERFIYFQDLSPAEWQKLKEMKESTMDKNEREK